MTKQDIEALAAARFPADNQYTYDPCYGKREGFIAGFLAAQEMKWHKVTNQLPPYDTKVLFMLNENDMRFGTLLEMDQWGRENMFCDGAFHFPNTVLYWCYCPAPPSINNQK